MVATEFQPGSPDINRLDTASFPDKDFARQITQRIAGIDGELALYSEGDGPEIDQRIFDLRMQKGQMLADVLVYQSIPTNPRVAIGTISTHPQEVIHQSSQNEARFLFLTTADSQNAVKTFTTTSPLHFIRKPGVIDHSDDAERLTGANRTDTDSDETFYERTKEEAATLHAYEELAKQLGEEAQIHSQELTEDFLVRRVLELRHSGVNDYYWKIKIGLYPTNDKYPAKLKIDLKMNYDRYFYNMPPPDVFDEAPQQNMRMAIGQYDFGPYKGQDAATVHLDPTDRLSEITTTEKYVEKGHGRQAKPSPLLLPQPPEVILVAPVHIDLSAESITPDETVTVLPIEIPSVEVLKK